MTMFVAAIQNGCLTKFDKCTDSFLRWSTKKFYLKSFFGVFLFLRKCKCTFWQLKKTPRDLRHATRAFSHFCLAPLCRAVTKIVHKQPSHRNWIQWIVVEQFGTNRRIRANVNLHVFFGLSWKVIELFQGLEMPMAHAFLSSNFTRASNYCFFWKPSDPKTLSSPKRFVL